MDFRFVVEQFFGEGDVGEGVFYVAGAGVGVYRLNIFAKQFVNYVNSLITVMAFPQAIFKTWPAVCSARAASRLASTTLSIYVKSRLCRPSPKTVGGLSFNIAVTKAGMAAAYWLVGS